MARTDLLINLVRAGSQGDHAAFRRTLEAIIADERSRQHHVVADRLGEFLSQKASEISRSPGETNGGLFIEIHPKRGLSDLVLPAVVRESCCELVEEQQRADLLRSYSLEPRHRVLLAGAPGNGKTSLAEAIAGELSIPLLVVRYEAIIGSYLGETAMRLGRLFEYVRTRQCVLFFDEFDAIGKERGDEHETGEIKRVVSSLLLNIDRLPAYVLAVTATNHPELLDRAVWRRFQLRLELPAPGPKEAEEWVRRFESRTALQLGLPRRVFESHFNGISYAELEEFCLDVQRRATLDGVGPRVNRIATKCLARWRARFGTRR